MAYGIKCQIDGRAYYLSLWDFEAPRPDLVALDEETARHITYVLERALKGGWKAVRQPPTRLMKGRRKWKRAPGDEGVYYVDQPPWND